MVIGDLYIRFSSLHQASDENAGQGQDTHDHHQRTSDKAACLPDQEKRSPHHNSIRQTDRRSPPIRYQSGHPQRAARRSVICGLRFAPVCSGLSRSAPAGCGLRQWVGSPAAFLCKLSHRPGCIKNEYFLPNMQYFDGVHTSYFSLYSKKLFLKRRCMH